jgi:copper transport protein
VTLQFNEAVEASFGAVRVYDSRGREVQAGAPRHPGGHSDRVAWH